MIFSLLFGGLQAVAVRVVMHAIHAGFVISAVFSICHYLGWWERFLWWSAERELSKIANGAQITIGSFRLNWGLLLQGKIIVHGHNLIIHTPQRDLWRWHAPLIARIGYIEVECNAPITLLHDILFKVELPLELYSVQVSDLQVFIERRQHIFNFYLLDPAIILPDPLEIQAITKTDSGVGLSPDKGDVNDYMESSQNNGGIQDTSFSSLHGDASAQGAVQQDGNASIDNFGTPHENKKIAKETAESREQAKELVDEMLLAVKTLGKAARRGGLQGAIQQQGHNLADKLRDLKTNNKESLEKGVKVIQQVGKVAVEQLAPRKLEQLVPQRMEGGKPPPLARIGRIVLNDIRLFTRDSWIKSEEFEGSTTAVPGPPTSGSFKMNGWNKPIAIAQVVVRSSELCPPMSLLDEDGLPAIYQPLDKLGEVIWKRILTEMTKSNKGRLFQTALGEVLGYMKMPAKTVRV